MLLIRPRTILLACAVLLILIGLGALFSEFRHEAKEANEKISQKLSVLENLNDDRLEVSGDTPAVDSLTVIPASGDPSTHFPDWPIWLLAAGAFLALMTVLWNSATLDTGWLASVGFAFKGLGAIVVLVVGQWFAMRANQEGARLAVTELAEKKAQRAQEERAEERNRRDRIVTNLIERIGEGGSENQRLLFIRSSQSEIIKGEDFGSELLQILHGIAFDACIDSDPKVREFGTKIGKILFPGIESEAQYPNNHLFILALKKRLNQLNDPEDPVCTEDERFQLLIYSRCFEHLEKDEIFASVVTEIGTLTGSVVARSGESFVQNQSSSNTEHIASASLADIASVAAFSASKQITGVVSEKVEEIRKGVELLEKIDQTGDKLERAISLLPINTIGAVPPRIYIHVPSSLNEGQKEQVDRLRETVREKMERQIILPDVRVVETGVGGIPESTQVRYYRNTDTIIEEKTRLEAERIADIIRAGMDSVVEVYGVSPSKSDFKVSRGLDNKFEIWFSTNAKIKTSS